MGYSEPRYYLNRELSMLAFQHRVLREGLDPRNPLLERVKSMFYFTNNTDEFFMKRVGMLKQQMDAGIERASVDGMTPRAQWEAAFARFRSDLALQYRGWREDLEPALAENGIRLVSLDELSDEEGRRLRRHFASEILPTLTPLAFDPAHPFPFLSNLSLSIGMYARQPRAGQRERVFTRVKVPANRDPFIRVREAGKEWVAVPLADLIVANLDVLLADSQVEDVCLFRVTRSAEVELDEEVAEDLVGHVRAVIERRRRAPAVRLEVDQRMPESMRGLLLDQLGLSRQEMIEHPGLVDFRGFEPLSSIERPDLKYRGWAPQPHPWLPEPEAGQGERLFERIAARETLVHHPYHSFEQTTLRFLERAADDPRVVAIKIAIYRTNNDSKVLDALMRAAANGKQVAVLVELKARFDEDQNVRWVGRLEERGIHVAYGKQDRKTHTKLALVVRQEPDGMRLYSHIGTGNYHSGTAKGFTDLALLTADEAAGRDVLNVFNIFTGPHHRADFGPLLIAPFEMRRFFLEAVAREAELAAAGRGGRIIAKANALEDPAMVEGLYEAAAAGVEIDLIVRDICRFRPRLKGVSERARVHSVVGRFLEHSRIFHFGNAGGEPLWYLGSADWMKRNLDKRMEAVTPVRARALQGELRVILEVVLADNRRRWRMQPDGTYLQCEPEQDMPELDCQDILMGRAEAGLFGEHGPWEKEVLRRQPGPRARITDAG